MTPHVVTVPKAAGAYRELKVVVASDMYLGLINGADSARRLVRMVNDLNPDLVFLAGDIMDDSLESFVDQQLAAELSKLQSKFGTYAMLGNHDAQGAELPAYRQDLERSGIKLLVDSWAKVGDSFYVVGRRDAGAPPASTCRSRVTHIRGRCFPTTGCQASSRS